MIREPHYKDISKEKDIIVIAVSHMTIQLNSEEK